jgi:hypothetical protein
MWKCGIQLFTFDLLPKIDNFFLLICRHFIPFIKYLPDSEAKLFNAPEKVGGYVFFLATWQQTRLNSFTFFWQQIWQQSGFWWFLSVRYI